MRRWLLELHLHLGLLCLPYVVVLGVSGILLNHGAPRGERSEWSARIAAPEASAPARARAEAALAALGLHAGVLPQTVQSGAAGEVSFRALRIGRTYQVSVDASGAARVAERDFGVLGVMRDLHGRRDTGGSAWDLGWALYTDLTTAVLLFSVASGAWLALARASGRGLRLGVTLLGAAAVVALAAVLW